MSTEPKAIPSILALQVILPKLLAPMRRSKRGPYRRIWTPLVVLWGLIYQRLNADHTCDAVVSHVLAGGADHLDADHLVPLSERVQSESSSAYCQGRARLPLAFVQAALAQTAARIPTWLGDAGRWLGHQVALLDGSSLLLQPTPELSAAYASHQNQHGPTYWLGMRLLAAFCLYTGTLLAVTEASIAVSEQALVRSLLRQLPADLVWVGDRNFGVFSVAQATRHYHQHLVVRVKRATARLIARRALSSGCDLPVVWRRGQHAYAHPDLDPTPIAGRLIYVCLLRNGFPPVHLYLFTTLTDTTRYPLTAVVELYGQRWHVELDLRYVKTTLDMDLLTAKSPEMVRKELYAGCLAYNLIRACMTQAALQAALSPLTLSFTQCWRRIHAFLTARRSSDPPQLLACRFKRLLSRLAQCRLPLRAAFRIEPRAVRRRPAVYLNLKGSRAAARRQTVLKMFMTAKS